MTDGMNRKIDKLLAAKRIRRNLEKTFAISADRDRTLCNWTPTDLRNNGWDPTDSDVPGRFVISRRGRTTRPAGQQRFVAGLKSTAKR
jgi:hypothetical protein